MNINRINKFLFNSLIGITHWLTETPTRNIIGKPVVRGLGALTTRVKAARPQSGPQAAAEEWQRMFPSRKMVPITRVEPDVVHAEIHSACPYRGSGNVAGCQRMMEYDRKLMEAIGADFVVVRSQAEPGVQHCQVAIGRGGALPSSALERLSKPD